MEIQNWKVNSLKVTLPVASIHKFEWPTNPQYCQCSSYPLGAYPNYTEGGVPGPRSRYSSTASSAHTHWQTLVSEAYKQK
jgi:hypothetical protein